MGLSTTNVHRGGRAHRSSLLSRAVELSRTRPDRVRASPTSTGAARRGGEAFIQGSTQWAPSPRSARHHPGVEGGAEAAKLPGGTPRGRGCLVLVMVLGGLGTRRCRTEWAGAGKTGTSGVETVPDIVLGLMNTFGVVLDPKLFIGFETATSGDTWP